MLPYARSIPTGTRSATRRRSRRRATGHAPAVERRRHVDVLGGRVLAGVLDVQLELALLDAHLGRCDECRAVADDFGAAAHMLRATPQEPVALVAVDLPRSPRRLLTTVAVAAVLVLGVIAGSIVRGDSSHQATKP